MRKKTEVISIRLELELIDMLDEQAQLDRTTRGAWVRRMVESSLRNPFDHAQLLRLLVQLKNSQAQALYQILTRVAGMEAKAAEDLVRSKLLRE